MPYIVREVSTTDLDALWDLAGYASTGMTSLKVDRDELADRIERAHFAFRRTSEKAEGAPYVFVIEDTSSHRLIGTSCIFSKTGGFEPFYAYRIVNQTQHSELLGQTRELRSLHLLKIHNGPTELGGLFLLPDCRGGGAGKLLSLSRFLYMAGHLKRFAKETIAELRGYLDEKEESPFWNAIGSHFFPIDYPRADALSMIDKQFIEDLMPQYPIYLELLPQKAIEAIGQVHEQAKPAYQLLIQQGFVQRDLIDIFDGGAVLHCETNRIDAVRCSKVARVAEIRSIPSDAAGWESGLVSIENPRFHCTLGRWIADPDLAGRGEPDKSSGAPIEEVVLDTASASRLSLSIGDSVRLLPLRSCVNS
ncbi:MAG: arginine N-succinyltransferase [Planctomycetota bacterium]|jgi:arginine N-succinyltransferase